MDTLNIKKLLADESHRNILLSDFLQIPQEVIEAFSHFLDDENQHIYYAVIEHIYEDCRQYDVDCLKQEEINIIYAMFQFYDSLYLIESVNSFLSTKRKQLSFYC